MIILDLTQGSPEWLAARAKHFCASEAPAMMGASKYQSRSELLRLKATGIAEEVDARKQALFGAGHKAEAGARKFAEEEFGPLPAVTATDDAGWLLASFDGYNQDQNVGWEHKLWNERLAESVRAHDLPPHYFWQLEHQILVGGLNSVVFTCSDGTKNRCVSTMYGPVPGRAEQLIAGWKQFESDLATYVPPEVLPPVVARPTLNLPAVSIRVDGILSLATNLDRFMIEATAFIATIPVKPSTEQEFADCRAAVKKLQESQNMLDAAEAGAIAQISAFDLMRRTKAMCFDLVRNARLAVEKLVVAREREIKDGLVMDGRDAFSSHVAKLNARLGKLYMPVVQTDFPGAIKGLSKFDSMKDKIDGELARCKILANEIADKIQLNLHELQAYAEYSFLFPDAAQLVLKAPDDFTVFAQARIAAHKAKREEEARERMRAEEQAKAEAKIEPVVAQTSTSASRGADSPSGATSVATAATYASGQPQALVNGNTPDPIGVARLRGLIASSLIDCSPGELQQALDAIREIKAARVAA